MFKGTTRRPVWAEGKTEALEEIRSELEQDRSSQNPSVWLLGLKPLEDIALVMRPGADGAHSAFITCLASLARLRSG